MLWPAGPVCPKCGVIGEAYELKGVRSKPSKKRPEGKERHGLRKCKACGPARSSRKAISTCTCGYRLSA